jgi:ribosomal protein L35
MLEHKSSKRKRVMNKQQLVSPADVKHVRRLAPYL